MVQVKNTITKKYFLPFASNGTFQLLSILPTSYAYLGSKLCPPQATLAMSTRNHATRSKLTSVRHGNWCNYEWTWTQEEPQSEWNNRFVKGEKQQQQIHIA